MIAEIWENVQLRESRSGEIFGKLSRFPQIEIFYPTLAQPYLDKDFIIWSVMFYVITHQQVIVYETNIANILHSK